MTLKELRLKRQGRRQKKLSRQQEYARLRRINARRSIGKLAQASRLKDGA